MKITSDDEKILMQMTAEEFDGLYRVLREYTTAVYKTGLFKEFSEGFYIEFKKNAENVIDGEAICDEYRELVKKKGA